MKHILLLFALSLGYYVGHAQEDVQDVTVSEILTNYFENTGGVDAWKANQNIRMEATMGQMGMEFSGIITRARPAKQHLEIDIQGQKMIQAYDGTDAWWINPFMGGTEAQPMPPEMATEFTSEEFEDKFLGYEEKGHTVELLGQKEIDGAMCYEVKLTKKTGEEEFTYFEMENFVPIMQKTIVKSGPTEGQASETYFSNYEEAGDFIMPMYIESRVNGEVQLTITVTKAEFDVEIEDSLFSMPK